MTKDWNENYNHGKANYNLSMISDVPQHRGEIAWFCVCASHPYNYYTLFPTPLHAQCGTWYQKNNNDYLIESNSCNFIDFGVEIQKNDGDSSKKLKNYSSTFSWQRLHLVLRSYVYAANPYAWPKNKNWEKTWFINLMMTHEI